MNRTLAVDCKTVIVTEEVCPVPTVTYPNTPEISFSGTTATCRVTINTNDGSGPDHLQTNLYGYSDDNTVVNLNDQINMSLASQTVDLVWEMIAPTTSCHCAIEVQNRCGTPTGWVMTADYEYVEDIVNIVATNLDVTPATCEAPCDIGISITWTNNGTVAGIFTPGFTVNGSPYVYADITLGAGQSVTENYAFTASLAGTYIICPSPNP